MHVHPVEGSPEDHGVTRFYIPKLTEEKESVKKSKPIEPPSAEDIHAEEMHFQHELHLDEQQALVPKHEDEIRHFTKELFETPRKFLSRWEYWNRRIELELFYNSLLTSYKMHKLENKHNISKKIGMVLASSMFQESPDINLILDILDALLEEVQDLSIEEIMDLIKWIVEAKFYEQKKPKLDHYLKKLVTQLSSLGFESKLAEIRQGKFVKMLAAIKESAPPVEVTPTMVDEAQTLALPSKYEHAETLSESARQAYVRLIAALVHEDFKDFELIEFERLHLNYIFIKPPMLITNPYLIDAYRRIVEPILDRLVHIYDNCAELNMAIVTHPSASIPEDISHMPGVEVLKLHTQHAVKYYYEVFERLANQGFKRIVTLLPHKEYWLANQYALLAAHRHKMHIEIIDTHQFGLGLGVLSNYLVKQVLYHTERVQVQRLLNTKSSEIGHWVVPFHKHRLFTHGWFQKVLTQYENQHRELSRNPDQVVCLRLSQVPKLLLKTATFKKALLRIKQEWTIFFKDKKPDAAIIEHYQSASEAKLMEKALHMRYPGIKTLMRPANEFLRREYGPHVACCLFNGTESLED